MTKISKKSNNSRYLLPLKAASDLEIASNAAWIAKPYLSRGSITELSGPAKSGGKTTLTLDILRGVFERGTFLDVPVDQKVKVLYATEEHDPTFQRALTAAKIADVPFARLAILQWFDLKNQKWGVVAEKLHTDIATHGSDLLVIDTFPQFAFHGDESENEANQALKAMTPIHKIISKNVAVLLIRHDRKSGGDVGYSARGSTAFGGAADIMLQIRRKGRKTSPVRILSARSRFEETPEEITIERTKDGFRRIRDGIDAPAHHAVLGVFNGAPLTIAEIKINSGLQESTVYRAVNELLEVGRLIAQGTGKKNDPKRFIQVPAVEAFEPQDIS